MRRLKKKTEILQLQYEDEKKARQLVVLEKQQARDRFEFWLLVIVSAAVSLMALLMIYTLSVACKKYQDA